MDSSGFEPEASPMPRGRSSADLRAQRKPYNHHQQIKFLDTKLLVNRPSFRIVR